MKAPLLSLSLAANVLLLGGVGYLALAPRSAESVGESGPATDSGQPPPASLGSAGSVPPTPAPPFPPTPETWLSPADAQAWLLSTHAPPKVRYMVAMAMLGRKYGDLHEAIRRPPTMKRWQYSHTRPTEEQRNQQAALNAQQTEELKQLLGADYIRATYDEDAAARAGLSLEKYAAVQRVRNDYLDLRLRQTGSRAPGALELLNNEMTADLTQILTPEEYEIHQAYESQQAQILQQWMTGLNVDDETYLRVFRVVDQARAKNPLTYYSRSIQEEELRAIETAAGPEVARHIVMSRDGGFREFDRLYAAADLPTSVRYEKYQAWNQFRGTVGRLERTNATPGKLDESQRAMIRSAYDRLTAGLSPTTRAEFDRTSTGAFMARMLAAPTP